MSSTAFNLLLAFLLLAANAFYVAAEFALVKSRGFRIRAMVEQDRFGARLLHSMMGNIEAYLACCQLGITMVIRREHKLIPHVIPQEAGREPSPSL